MMLLCAVALAWCLLLWIFVRSRLALHAVGSREIEFLPTEDMSAERLFGCLLSGNFAILMGDNFNQLASALPAQRVKDLLAEHWGIRTREDCIRIIEHRMDVLGEISQVEMHSVAAWLGEQRSADGRRAPVEHSSSGSPITRLAEINELRHGHLSVLAWDIQQLSYLVRLARAIGHVSQTHAETLLKRLAARARVHYDSWSAYSLTALIGLGMRSSMDVFETSDWERFSSTHSVLLRGRRSPIRFASTWRVAPAAPALQAGCMTPAFDLA